MSPDPQVFEHFDREALTYAERSEGWLWAPLRRREAEVFMTMLAARPGERVLDAGCGAGHCTRLIQQHGAEAVGCDGAEAMVEAARSAGFEAFHCNLEESVPEGSPYDKILCAGALEFCQQPARVIENLSNALKPEGQLVVFLPRRSLLGRLYRRSHRRHGFEIHLFTEEDLRSWESETLRLKETRRVAFSLAARYSR